MLTEKYCGHMSAVYFSEGPRFGSKAIFIISLTALDFPGDTQTCNHAASVDMRPTLSLLTGHALHSPVVICFMLHGFCI